MVAKAYAKGLIAEGKEESKQSTLINCSMLKSVREFMDKYANILDQEERTFFFDECSELPNDVTMALLTILNPNKHNNPSKTTLITIITLPTDPIYL